MSEPHSAEPATPEQKPTRSNIATVTLFVLALPYLLETWLLVLTTPLPTFSFAEGFPDLTSEVFGVATCVSSFVVMISIFFWHRKIKSPMLIPFCIWSPLFIPLLAGHPTSLFFLLLLLSLPPGALLIIVALPALLIGLWMSVGALDTRFVNRESRNRSASQP